MAEEQLSELKPELPRESLDKEDVITAEEATSSVKLKNEGTVDQGILSDLDANKTCTEIQSNENYESKKSCNTTKQENITSSEYGVLKDGLRRSARKRINNATNLNETQLLKSRELKLSKFCDIIQDSDDSSIFDLPISKKGRKRKTRNKILIVQKKQPWLCDVCGEEFKVKIQRDEHRAQEHCGQCKCLECREFLPTWEELQRHVSEKHPETKYWLEKYAMNEKKYVCKVCGILFTVYTKLMRHLNHHFNIRDFKCSVCGKGFIERTALNKHLESHESRNIPCEICGKIFKHERGLKKHRFTHEEGCRFVCNTCGRGYRSLAALQAHISRHNPEGSRFRCPECQKDCGSKDYLRGHIVQMHQRTTGEHKCPECGKIFKWEQTLKSHLAVKHDYKNGTDIVLCTICGKRFPNKHILKAHLPKHDDQRPYHCEICSQAFKYKASKDNHIEVVHSDKRDFQCNTCGKLFKTKPYLDMHIQNVHTDSQPVKCRKSPNNSFLLSHQMNLDIP